MKLHRTRAAATASTTGEASGSDHLLSELIDHPWPELSACC